VAVGATKDNAKGFEREFVSRAVTFWESDLYLRRDGKLVKIEKPFDAEATAHREWLYIRLRTPWEVGGKTYPAGALLAANFEGFLKGVRAFDVLFEPTERKSLDSFSPTRGHVLLNELDNVRSRLYVLTHKDGTSKHGTKVPYFQVSRENLKLDGTNPTLLYGYGGFEVSLTPGYHALAGAGWMEKGGVFVVANIRGGGEFGPKWHQAALKEKRHKAYEDFAAVAEDLIKRKVTSPKHLGIEGGSNGGL